ncbi:MAG: cupin domain-containing protein [Leptothrix sp. (in: b-proteobacteria)]
MSHDVLPAPQPAPDVLADESVALLLGAATDWCAAEPPSQPQLRARLMARVARSARASTAFVTVRRKDTAFESLAPGVRRRRLYAAAPATTVWRPGQPHAASLIELAPGACWQAALVGPALQQDWLVLRGVAQLDDLLLQQHDYQVRPAGSALPLVRSSEGALLYLREADPASITAPVNLDLPLIARAGSARWDSYGSRIRRRMLWQAGQQGAFLIHALPGASVPGHLHHHDEECLMLEGELFLDEVLLRTGEYQLAPGGSHHDIGVSTDTGVLIYAHGDIDLVFPG